MHTTATTKGQVIIPAEVRRKLGITKGTRFRVEFDEAEGTITLRPVTADSIRRLRGSLKGTDLTGDLARERARDRDREDKPWRV